LIVEYENCKLNANALSHKSINVMQLHEEMIVELDESPSTGYSWHYIISDSSIIDLKSKNTFDFNKPNVIGGSQQIIWRFQCLQCGECKIHFTYYNSWKGDTCSIDEYIYILKVE